MFVVGVAAINQYIYVVGGFDGNRQLASVERFDTEHQVWELVAPVKIARSALSLTSLDGKLYAIGGFDGTNFLSIVEVYDPKTNKWDLGTPLSSGRSGHASAIIYQPACVSYFIECLDSEAGGGNGSGPSYNSKKPEEDSFGKGVSNNRQLKLETIGANCLDLQFHALGSSGRENCENSRRSFLDKLCTLPLKLDYVARKEKEGLILLSKAIFYKKLVTEKENNFKKPYNSHCFLDKKFNTFNTDNTCKTIIFLIEILLKNNFNTS